MLTFAIGDIHGSHDKLIGLLTEIRRYADGRPSKYVLLGDYIDRGPDSCRVIETILEMQTADPDNVIALCGNHEELLLHADSYDGMAQWLIHGGGITMRSYDVTSPKDIPSAHRAWLQNLPTFHDDGQRFFVHAGIRPGIPLSQQSRNDLLWIREPFLSSSENHGRLIVHGHTRLRDGQPDFHPNRINLDTGAAFGRALTAAAFKNTEKMPSAVLQFPAS